MLKISQLKALFYLPYIVLSISLFSCHQPVKPHTQTSNGIISLAPSITETLFALHQESRLVGVTRYDTEPEAAKSIQRIGDGFQLNIEAIVRLQPQFIFALNTQKNVPHVQTLQRMGYTLVFVPNEKLEDLWSMIHCIGKTLNIDSESKQYTALLRTRIQRISENMNKESQNRRVLMLVQTHPFVAASHDTYFQDMFNVMHVQNVVTSSQAYPTLNLETIVQLNPDVVLCLDMEQSSSCNHLFPGSLNWLQKRVKMITHTSVLRLGPRFPEALSVMQGALKHAT